MHTPRKINCPACGAEDKAPDHYVGAGLYACNWDHRTPVNVDDSGVTEDEQV